MKYHIKTFGCQMNHSDSERIAGYLERNGLKKTDVVHSADLVIFNTCGVRQMAEDRVYGQIHNLKKSDQEIKIVLTGCLANRRDVKRRLKDNVDLFFPISNFEEFENWFIENFKKSKTINCKLKTSPKNSLNNYFSIDPLYSSRHTAFVPIMTGCNNFCAYCVVPYARGREVSRDPKKIISEIKSLIKKGYKEIFLLGQNVNSYRFIDKNSSADEADTPTPPSLRDTSPQAGEEVVSFSNLLKKINSIPGKFWINFISNHPKDITQELIETVTKLKKVCELIHLPIQSGDDTVLRNMNRKYTSQEYLKLVKDIKKAFQKNKPGKLYSLTSDIIVGFPGETKEQFEKSAGIMREVGYDMVFFGQYSPRPETAAWKLKDSVSKPEKARRENLLNEILKKTAFENNQKYLGKTLEILIDKKKGESYFGRTRTGKNVKLTAKEKNLVGSFMEVEIIKANIWNLEAQIPKEKIIVILGPTSSGKSDVAIRLAQKFDGEIISADSRQIYRHLDIGSGKITKAEQKMAPHHMLDIVSPRTRWSAGQFKKKAEKTITEILQRGKVPIICGGTGFWIKALVDNVEYPEVKPDWKLREKLTKKSTEELFQKLKSLDPERAKNIDPKNKVRLIRAIEICQTLGKVPSPKSSSKYEFLQIGIDWPKEVLQERIEKRLAKRFRAGMIKEVENLRKIHKLSWKRIEEFGLGYFWIAKYFQGKISKDEIFEKVFQAEKDYAKRQMTWFSKDKRILWIPKYNTIQKEVEKFLS